ncbi:chemotaxis protein CheW [Methanogenium organophilum]|uniref:Chemotaxis protein CheW n=1 Tax=Methanogenium organophilum TaxID=2199 RepID=A0A9X9S6I4_METOG|nr:chemotaxis protein CheW [Methanogenium organophilum]WAI02323.1 chemotaxis protein CheW [Methanogenium organophilum]
MATIDVVVFEIGGENYAFDIHLAREIVEMIPITPVPGAPPYIAGIINLRGEITNIIRIDGLLSLNSGKAIEDQKIIVLIPPENEGSGVGIIVDEVHSVNVVSEDDIEQMEENLSYDSNGFIKGIIKVNKGETKKEGLVIWLDMEKVLGDLIYNHQR